TGTGGPGTYNLSASNAVVAGSIITTSGGTQRFSGNGLWTQAVVPGTDSAYVEVFNGVLASPRVKLKWTVLTAPAISISNSDPINCGPSSNDYTSTLTASSTATYTYTWNASPALNTVNGATVIATINNTTVFTVSGTDGFCTASVSEAVSRFDFPALSVTAQFDSVCTGNNSVLTAVIPPPAFSVTGTGYSPISLDAPTFLLTNEVAQVPLSTGGLDDGGWIGVPIGFTYDYFGNPYTTVNVSTNGNLQFGTLATFSDSYTPGAIPSTALPNNYIAGLWTDWNWSDFSNDLANSIRYQTKGIAPNRIFAILLDGTRYNEPLTSRYTVQIELYETTGNVKVHITNCSDAASATIICGVENSDGTIGSAAPGRATDFSATFPANFTPEAWIFTPPTTYSTQWSVYSGTGTIVGTSNTPVITTAPAAPSTTYQLVVTDNSTGCDNSVNNQTLQTVSVITAPPVTTFTASPAA
ncbi:MAG: hypothetical protein ACKO7B_05680, partial [Flavobacteriales bacterium]